MEEPFDNDESYPDAVELYEEDPAPNYPPQFLDNPLFSSGQTTPNSQSHMHNPSPGFTPRLVIVDDEEEYPQSPVGHQIVENPLETPVFVPFDLRSRSQSLVILETVNNQPSREALRDIVVINFILCEKFL
jgi:hypothetical protein